MPVPVPGQFVRLRRRIGRVVSVASHHGAHNGVDSLVEVSYLDAWTHPESDTVVWHLEEPLGAQAISTLTLPSPFDGQADLPDDLGAMVDACRWSALDRLPEWSADPLERAQHIPLTGTWHSAVEPEDYQLVPVLKALSMPRVALLLADDVGLGKTIEAGLTLAELFNRRRVRRVLVLCPAGLQQQWKEELRDKFNLDFEVMDSRAVDQLRRSEGFDSNPWMVHPRLITSMDFLKQEGIKDQFLEAAHRLSQDGQSLFPGFDLLIVDEAHNLAPSGLGDDSQRTQLLRALLPCFEHRLFLTATPHNGNTMTFTGLLELLDPVRFQQNDVFTDSARKHLSLVMVRRLKKEINDQSVEPRFKERRIQAIPLGSYHPKEQRLWEALRAYRDHGLAVLGGLGKREQQVGRFIFTLLSKRALSSTYAFARTWWAHLEGLQDHLRQTDVFQQAGAAQRQAEREAENEASRDLWDQEAAQKGARWLRSVADDLLQWAGEVSQALEALGWTRAYARRAGTEEPVTPAWPAQWPEDARWHSLLAWVHDKLRTDSDWTVERLILFTEYKDTLDYLMARLASQGMTAPRVECLHGGSGASERTRIRKLFNEPKAELRILVATDAASEGLNFQASCRFVIHQELPWSPTKLEQRNGRVDRHGQFRDVVAHHFVSDQDEDLAFLGRLAEKVHTVREELGSAGQILDAAVTEHFFGHKASAQTLLNAVQATVGGSTALKDTEGADRGSREVLERTQRQLLAMEKQMGFSPARLRRLLERALARHRGHLAPVDHRPAHFTLQEPKQWEELVQTSLADEKGNRPYLVFDPAVMERRENGIRTLLAEPDSMLLRLGHPVLRRSLHEVMGWIHDQKTQRWTLGRGDLPPGMEAMVVLHAELRVQNDLRENLHHEILSFPFRWAGQRLEPLDDAESIACAIKPLERLPEEREKGVHQRLLQVWGNLAPTLAETLETHRAHWLTRLDLRAKAWRTHLVEESKVHFEARLREIEEHLSPRGMAALEAHLLRRQKELQAARQQAPALLPEFEEERLLDLRSLEVDVAAKEARRAFLDQRREELKAMALQLRLAQDRWLNQILPRRYQVAPAGLSLLPLALEIRMGGQA